jgi:hypothetical protein
LATAFSSFLRLISINGITLTNRYINPKMRLEKAKISHVNLNPYRSLKNPPIIGAMRHPIPYELLNTPAAKSDNYSLSSVIPSFSLTASRISAGRGTKMNEIEKPFKALPKSISVRDYGKPRISLGPNIIREKKLKNKENNVR